MAPTNNLHKQSQNRDERHSNDKKFDNLAKLLSIITNPWTLIIAFPIYTSFELIISFNNGAKGPYAYFIFYFLNDLLFFFINYHIVLPLALKTRKSLFGPIMLIFCSLLFQTFLSNCILAYFFSGSGPFFSVITFRFTLNHFWQAVQKFILIFIFWGAITLIREILRQRAAEENYLYSRISPHLLHNVLNQIHNTIQYSNSRGGEVIRKFSAFTRHAMKELDSDGKTSLNDEVIMVNDFIEIQCLRFEQEIYIKMDIQLTETELKYRIPPQIIVTPIENMFKYGVINDPDRPMIINIFTINNVLHIHLKNDKDLPAEVHPPSNKIGLNNMKRRLRMTYGNRAGLLIKQSEQYFILQLTIPLNL